MFRTVTTRALRVPVTPTIAKSTQTITRSHLTNQTIRFSSTTPPNKAPRRGVKSFTARFVAVTGTLLFLYNSELWDQTGRQVIPIPPTQEPVTLPTEEDISSRLALLDEITTAEKAEQEARAAQLSKPSDGIVAGNQSGGAEDLEQEAANQGAFNEETGEINWDCPCLGGMAHGPCGEEFRTAFSCFVYSKEDPKGIECIDKFKGMQDCFRQHPELYGSELSSDDDEESEARRAETVAEAKAQGIDVDGTTQEPTTVQGTLEDNSRDRKPTEHEVAVDDPRLGEILGTKEDEDRKIAEEKKLEERREIEKKVEEFEEKVIEEEKKTVPAAIGTPSVEILEEKPVVSEK